MFRDSDDPQPAHRVHVCFGPNCSPRGSRPLLACFQQEALAAGISNDIEVLASTCRGRCDWGPSVNVYPGPVLYCQVTPDIAGAIVREHLLGGRPVLRHTFAEVTSHRAQSKR